MKSRKRTYWLFILVFEILVCIGCNVKTHDGIQEINRKPIIDPLYSGVTVPANIAPLNFSIKEEGNYFKIIATSNSNKTQINISCSNGVIQFPEKSWRKLLKSNSKHKIKIQVFSSKKDEKILTKFEAIYINIVKPPIDPYLVYRLIHPAYYNWSNIKIVQRSIESFDEESLVENQLLEKNCINCHSFNKNNQNNFLLHVRGSKGGTYIVENDTITRTSLKAENMTGGATYPSWHPEGRFIAFSSNHVRQKFYAHAEMSIEVYDKSSSLVLYDRLKNEMLNIAEKDSINHMFTFPSWSPCGKYLYFCISNKAESASNLDLKDIKSIKYDLARKSFNQKSRLFGNTEIIFNASEQNKSASFPKISPDGQFMVFTLCDYGTFPIWHKEADLYLLDMQNGEHKRLDINSSETESYHSWSSNSKWLVFSSKRRDGRSARPYFAYINSWDEIGKPFVLPQKDPTLYNRMLKTFNIPEFVRGKVKMKPRDFEKAAKQIPIKAKAGDRINISQEIINKNNKLSEIEQGIHE